MSKKSKKHKQHQQQTTQPTSEGQYEYTVYCGNLNDKTLEGWDVYTNSAMTIYVIHQLKKGKWSVTLEPASSWQVSELPEGSLDGLFWYENGQRFTMPAGFWGVPLGNGRVRYTVLPSGWVMCEGGCETPVSVDVACCDNCYYDAMAEAMPDADIRLIEDRQYTFIEPAPVVDVFNFNALDRLFWRQVVAK